ASGVTLTQNAELHLLPRPREVKEAGGAAFKVTRRTRIVVSSALGGRNFEGAQMLEDEIEQWTGWELKISDAREMPGGSDVIYIGDATKDSKLRDALEKQGLTMAQGFDQQGYEISADAHRVLVGGASAEGAFYGVQTLRQLLRPENATGMNEKAGSSAPFANTATGLPSPKMLRAGGMTSETESASEVNKNKTNDGADRGAVETAEADSSSRLLLGMTDKIDGARFVTVALHGSVTGAQKKSAKSGAKNRPTRSARNMELICPGITIRDWPAMKWRGVSIDISRGPIPTLKFMENQIRVLAGFKLNMYALYMEDVFTVPGNGIFAPPDALMPDEIRELVNYAQKYYVTIVPELETYGHLHNVLRYDVYSQLAEVPHGSVLTPTQPGSYDLIGKMIAAMAPIFKGPFFHIGADETFELGRGQTKDLVAQKGLGQVYLDHIAKLDEMLKPYHKQTMFWADIAEHFPELLPTLPKDLIAVIWTYGNKDSYDARLAPFRNAGLQIFVSPGISNWRRVYPEFDGAYLNIRNLTRDGQKFGALGMLNTDWKDWGGPLNGMDWPGFVFGAACAWQPGESSIDEFRDSYDWAFYRNTDHTFEIILNKLADTNSMLDGVKMNGTYTSYFWADPFSQAGANYATTAGPVLHDMRVEAEQAWESLLENRGKARANADTMDDLIFAAHRLDFFGMKLQYTTEMSEAYWDAFMNMSDRRRVERDLQVLSSMNGDLQDLREGLTGLRDEYARRWRAENREYWLGNVTIRYDTLASAVQEKINEINVLEDNYSRLGQLPTPESGGFFTRPVPETNSVNNKK
ncbi:MAG TPA: family 20 glycosylhydrolase, partial [Candidatus Acidoferrales bacterium]|nr:family 20 glycosylhydrolase [Candidatus Acidoferrales bacterium]